MMVVGMAGTASADVPQPGTGSSGVGGSVTVHGGRTLQGTGEITGVLVSPNTISVVYRCQATATPDPSAVTYPGPTAAKPGCYLQQFDKATQSWNTIGVAPGISVPGPASTTGKQFVPVPLTGKLRLCWRPIASFIIGGDIIAAPGCTDGTNPDPGGSPGTTVTFGTQSP